MTEDKELLAKLSHLKQIKPRAEWVFLTRQRILGQFGEREETLLPGKGIWGMVERIFGLLGTYAEKPTFVIPVLTCLVGMAVVWQTAIESLPGDTLYPLRAAVEQVPFYFAGEEEKPFREFMFAQQRLSDLRIAAEENKTKNLPSAIQEFEANASKVSEEFLEIVENQPEKALQASRQVVQLQKEKLEVEKILGTKIGEEREEDIENAVRKLVEYELKYLETRSFTEEQTELFESAKTSVANGDYEAALEIIWKLSQK